MAGIGFILRKLARQDNLIGMAQAYAHSALASCGPWLFTIIALGSIMSMSKHFVANEEIFNFQIIIIYNFAFSLVFSGPVFMVATRYLADKIHVKDVSNAPGMLIGSILIVLVTQLPIVSAFYFLYANLSLANSLLAVTSFLLISIIWVVSVFVSSLKDFKAITRAFGFGLILSIFCSTTLSEYFGSSGILTGFSIGLCFIAGNLLAKVFAEYPYRYKDPFAFVHYFKKYWELALSGFIYNIAAWADKWVMWFSPEREQLPSNLIFYSNYDSAMFLAYLTIVPAMAMFVFSVETNFFEHYLRFFRDIQNKANFKKIIQNHESMILSIKKSTRNFIVLQGSICVMVILMAPKIFDALNINYMQIGIFRFGTLGAFFHALTLFLIILLSYFDNRKAALIIQLVFMVCNIGFTYVTMKLGFTYYGYGYFAATLVSFIVASVITMRYIANVPYHTFITTNNSV